MKKSITIVVLLITALSFSQESKEEAKKKETKMVNKE